MGRLLRKGSLCYAWKVFFSLILLVHAGVIPSGIITQRFVTGGALNLNSTLVGRDKGFSKANSGIGQAGQNCAAQVVFSSSPGTANNIITSGHIVYTVQLNTTSSTATNSCFTVTLTITSGGIQSSFSTNIGNGSTNTAGQTIDCKFDVGLTSLPTSPFSFHLSVP